MFRIPNQSSDGMAVFWYLCGQWQLLTGGFVAHPDIESRY